MIPSKIISLARKQTGNTPLGVVDADDAFDYLNIVTGDFWNDICSNNTGYGETTWTYDLVSGTADYTLATPIADTTLSASTFGITTIDKIGIKYSSSDSNYTPCQLVYLEGMLNLPEFYTTNSSKGSPVAIITDTSITIYPTPTSSVTNGLQIVGQKKAFDLSSTTEDVEGCILVPSHRHDVIIDGLKVWFYGAKGSDFEALKTKAANEYDRNKMKAINQIMDRNQDSSQSFTPDLSHLG